MNKKADISIVILVLGVVAISILTIFSFVGVSNERKGDFLGIGLIETMNSIEEELNLNSLGFTTDYKNDFEKTDFFGNIKIIISENNVKEGIYIQQEQKFVKGCDEKNWELFKKCQKEIVRVIYKK